MSRISSLRFAVAAMLAATGGLAAADIVHLKNGSRIEGTILEDRSSGDRLVLELQDGAGRIFIARSKIQALEKGPRSGDPQKAGPAPATLQEEVLVQLKPEACGFYGSRPLIGTIAPQSDAKTLILRPWAGGEIRIPREAVEKIGPAGPWDGLVRPEPAALGARQIKTTHIVRLKNGKVIRGDVAAGPEDAPLEIAIDRIGRILIPRSRIQSVEKADGEFIIPAPEVEVPAPQEPETPEASATEPETGKSPPAAGALQPRPLEAELKAQITAAVEELARWRSRNRVRAENHLRAIGPPAIPFLRGAAADPFDLTRRAALRIVRDVADPEGIPIAIRALLDDDDMVRETALEALQTMTREDLGYNPYDTPRRRLSAYGRWQNWWKQRQAGQDQ